MEDTEVGDIVYAAPWAFASGEPQPTPTAALPPVAAGDDDLHPTRRLRTLAFELTVAEARERQRIAHVLHDDVGQLLALAQFRLGELRHGLPGGDPGQAAALEELRQLLNQAARATRTATFELHSPVLQQLGLGAAVQGLAQRLQRSSTMQVHVAADDFPDDDTQDDAVLSVLFRIVRELSLNAQKHARATHLWIDLGRGEAGRPRIRVRDDGVGFDARAATRRFTPEGGFGLVSAEAQMNAIGGRLTVESTPGQGTIATLSLGPGLPPAHVPGPDPAPHRPPAHPTSRP